jgi:adenosylcobinamide-phosphate guanylyltransferase
MAGGKGTRIRSLGEKPLVKVGGTVMLRRVVTALKDSRHIGEIAVAWSHHAPKTAREAANLGIRAIMTPGLGYIEDLRHALNLLGVEDALVINSDLPFITGSIIDEVCDRYERNQKPALTVMVRIDKIRELGFEPSYGEQGLSPVGINVVRGPLVGDDEVDQEIFVVEDALSLININTPEDVGRAERLLETLSRR